ncbi:tetratricopeptide repeat protein, partial [Escherichia coli]|uniref:tetratricopeptide repeat protein n=2 Tax=Pseudomonadota TaxID=1224 RepID=UPI0013D561A1
GVCHSKLGRPEDALAAFEGALRINPDFPYAHNGRGLALATLGDRPGARAAHEHAAALDPNFAEPLGALAAMDV